MTTFTLTAAGHPCALCPGGHPLDPLVLSDIGSVRSYEWAPGEVRSVTQDAPDADGEIDTSQLHGAGSITIGVRLLSGVPFDTSIRRLRSFAHGRLRPVLEIDDGTTPMFAILSRGKVTSTAQRPTHQDAVAQWAVPSGVLESVTLHEEIIFPGVGTAVDGVEFDGVEFDGVEFPLVDPPGTSLVVNAGDRDAYPIIRAFGPFGDDVEFGNVTTGKSLFFTGLTVAVGDYLEIDFRAKTILLNGLSVQSRYNFLSFPTSEWWTLVPGVNEVSFLPDTFSGNANAVVFHRDAYS